MALIIHFVLSAVIGISGVYSHAIPRPHVGIIGGHNVTIESAPYVVSIWSLDRKMHTCGGSIIHELFILTAAHCLEVDESTLTVIVGATHLNGFEGTRYNVSKTIIHKKYFSIFDDDIGLLKLSTPLQFGDKVKKIKLPDEDFEVKVGSQLNVTGWGLTSVYGPQSKDLLQVTVPFISEAAGRDFFEKTYGLHIITSAMLCAGGDGKNPLNGDSGGPLTVNDIQVGVVSFGDPAAVGPAVFTKVTRYLPWINQTISDNL